MASIDKRIIKLVKTLERYRVDGSYINRVITHLINEEIPGESTPQNKPTGFDDTDDEVTHLGQFAVGDKTWFLADLTGKILKGTITRFFPCTQNVMMTLGESHGSLQDNHWGCAELKELYRDNGGLITENAKLETFKGYSRFQPWASHLKELFIGSEYWWTENKPDSLTIKRYGTLAGILNDEPEAIEPVALIAESRYSNEMGQTFVLHRVNPIHLTVKGH